VGGGGISDERLTRHIIVAARFRIAPVHEDLSRLLG
jgi:hypothetical protein